MIRSYIKHGMSKIPGYFSWTGILARCYEPAHKDFIHYGGRGISVCEFLRASPRNLIDLLGPKPAGCSVDRSDNDLGYTCGQCAECLKQGWKCNVRWATSTEQNRNKRRSLRFAYEGAILPAKELAANLGIPYITVRWRGQRGKPIAIKAETARRISFGGEQHTAKEWAEILGIPVVTINRRYRLGLPINVRQRKPKHQLHQVS